MPFRKAALLLCVGLMAAPAPSRRPAQRAAPKVKPARSAVAALPMDRTAGSSAQVAQWMAAMSVRDLAAQLVVVPFYGDNPSAKTREYKEFASDVRDLRVGGLIVVNRVVNGQVRAAEPHAMAAFLNRMQRLAKVPLIVGGDFERGASMRVTNTTKHPHLMAYGAARDLALTRYLGAATAREARALGVHWVFAPVTDVNNNPDNPIINIRSFGENPQEVASQVRAFVEGAHSDPASRVLVSLKHFPGHGDTSVDSHLGLARVTGDRARLESVELVPFKAAVAAGADSVMSGHLAVPALEPDEVPATVSRNVLTNLLRDQIGFRGLIVTDAMDMYGLSKQFTPGEAAVRSLEAGADILLMPPKPEEAVRAVAAAVRDGRLSRKRLEGSVARLLAAKVKLGLHRQKLVDLEAISDVVESPDAAERAQETAERAVTLVKNEGDLLPLRQPEAACVWVLAEGRYSTQGRRFMDEVQRQGAKPAITLLDPTLPQAEFDEASRKARDCSTQVVVAFASVAAYRGSVGLPERSKLFVEGLLQGPAPVALVGLGNPYLIRSFPTAAAYLATFSTVLPAETAAARALLGAIPVRGRLPVSIPGVAEYGAGIDLPALSSPSAALQAVP